MVRKTFFLSLGLLAHAACLNNRIEHFQSCHQKNLHNTLRERNLLHREHGISHIHILSHDSLWKVHCQVPYSIHQRTGHRQSMHFLYRMITDLRPCYPRTQPNRYVHGLIYRYAHSQCHSALPTCKDIHPYYSPPPII